MKKIGIFYGSSTGTCESLAEQLAGELGVTGGDVHSADKLTAELANTYDVLVLGTSTWGDGELQDDWYDAIKVRYGYPLRRSEGHGMHLPGQPRQHGRLFIRQFHRRGGRMLRGPRAGRCERKWQDRQPHQCLGCRPEEVLLTFFSLHFKLYGHDIIPRHPPGRPESVSEPRVRV